MSERDDEIRDWVRQVDPARPFPEEVAQRVEAATRMAWRNEVLRRRRRVQFQRGAALAASLLLVVVAVTIWRRPTAIQTASVHVVIVVEQAWQQAPGRPRVLLARGAEVVPGSEISTDGESRVALALPSGHSVRIDHHSRLRVVSASHLAIDRGAVYVASSARGRVAGTPVVVSTPAGDVREVGTQYEVRLDSDSTRVRVREGSVTVETAAATHQVDAGVELGLGARGAVRHAIASWGTDWSWVGRTAPPFEIEGRTLQEFLEWAAREGGWSVVFEHATTASRASSIILNGSIEGLPVEDALAAVLPTCQLTHRIENGRLSIRPADEREPAGS